MRKTIVALGLVLGAVPFFAACDNISLSSGEYTVIRIATVSPPTKGADCMVMPDPNHTSTSNVQAGSTIMVYGVTTSSGDVFVLDFGGTALQGAVQSDGTYQFNGKTTTVDKQQVGMGNDITVTKVTSETVTMTLAGDTASFKVVAVDSNTCMGTPCQAAQTNSCTTTDNFAGVAVSDTAVPPPAK